MNIILFENNELKNFLLVLKKNDPRFIHIKKILKLGVHDSFKAGIIDGEKGFAEIIRFDEKELIARFKPNEKGLALAPITLILGFPRPIQLRRILRDISGLGIAELWLTGTVLGEKSYMQSELAQESEIRRLLIDGCSQAGQTIIPKVSGFDSLRSLFKTKRAEVSAKNKKLLFDVLKTSTALSDISVFDTSDFLLAIGSERGWTEEERELFYEQNFTAVGMGARILRTETAVCAACAAILSKTTVWSKR
ncbi:RsmE family RNA methyltransferase [Treponema phagedenis]|uniref:Ribosomal RNA small subunit methyltransferase E n=1 Tax=Treponema phagedenis TaxID=162 RepID=A0A0B7GSI0_TREPH|nr:RsmE family RNA methyltransferase [Treponema phagedenis]NVP22939.1 RsmE family RNA methyltransferase [Treponema phagedenis]QEJ95060.1 RsmE family RNA methyltransferase [Treponema phagedenis]QEJ98266.1 RsmE family RNA methyltransferase [Treponema phagedenis]QEK00985.1 RsmE family RNA methyltransferase [Treponema phagedenis]QEK03777.1 RsmE family RNA methyltransferase [Treponema phagedenis]